MDDMPSDAELFLEHMHDYGVTVSLSGDFNPSFLQPARLGAFGVLTAEEAHAPKDYYSQPDFARFATGHLTFEASREAIEISTRTQANEARAEQAASQLLAALQQCPVREVSIARYAHFALEAGQRPVDLVSSAFESVSAVPRDDSSPTLGDSVRFAARSWQGVLLPGIWSNVLRAPRLDELTMRGDREDGRDGSVLITVEPSLIVLGGAFLAHIDIIQFTSASPNRETLAAEVTTVLQEAWKPTQQAAFKTFRLVRGALVTGGQHGEVGHE